MYHSQMVSFRKSFNRALLDSCVYVMSVPFVANLNLIKQHVRLIRTVTCSAPASKQRDYSNRWSLSGNRGVKSVDIQYAPNCEVKMAQFQDN